MSHAIVISFFFFFKQKTAYEMRISDWSSDVCSSDLLLFPAALTALAALALPLLIHLTRRSDRQLLDFAALRWLRAKECARRRQIGRASCRERVCQYV